MDTSDEARIQRMQENLATIRKVAGWSAQQLADEIGVTRQTISNLERGKTPLTKTQYIALRYVLNIEIAASENQALAKVITALVDDPIEDDEDVESEGTMDSLSVATSILTTDVSQDGGKVPLVSLAKGPLMAGALAGAMVVFLPGGPLLAPIGAAVAMNAMGKSTRNNGSSKQGIDGGGCDERSE